MHRLRSLRSLPVRDLPPAPADAPLLASPTSSSVRWSPADTERCRTVQETVSSQRGEDIPSQRGEGQPSRRSGGRHRKPAPPLPGAPVVITAAPGSGGAGLRWRPPPRRPGCPSPRRLGTSPLHWLGTVSCTVLHLSVSAGDHLTELLVGRRAGGHRPVRAEGLEQITTLETSVGSRNPPERPARGPSTTGAPGAPTARRNGPSGAAG